MRLSIKLSELLRAGAGLVDLPGGGSGAERVVGRAFENDVWRMVKQVNVRNGYLPSARDSDAIGSGDGADPEGLSC